MSSRKTISNMTSGVSSELLNTLCASVVCHEIVWMHCLDGWRGAAKHAVIDDIHRNTEFVL